MHQLAIEDSLPWYFSSIARVCAGICLVLLLAGAPCPAVAANGAASRVGPTDSIVAEPRANPPYDERMLHRMETLREVDPKAILLGDSQVAAWPERNWRTLFPDGAINFGAGGDSTANLLWRIQHAFAPGMQLRSALVLIGTNDLPTKSSEAIAASIRAIVSTVEVNAPKACVTIIGLLPRRDGRRDLEAKIQDVNRRLLALESPRVRFVNPHQQLVDACQGTGPCALYADTVHLTPAGYERLTSVVTKARQQHPCGD
jgi:lysophospholipase L1-like esterase